MESHGDVRQAALLELPAPAAPEDPPSRNVVSELAGRCAECGAADYEPCALGLAGCPLQLVILWPGWQPVTRGEHHRAERDGGSSDSTKSSPRRAPAA